MKRFPSKFLLLFFVALCLYLFFEFRLSEYLSLEYLKNSKGHFQSFYAENPFLSWGVFFSIYVFSTAFSIPGAVILTLAAGAFFGTWTGLLIVSFASTIGASLAFLMARFILRDGIQKRFASQFKSLNEGIAKEGAFYLFGLRLIPLFPFWLINLSMGLTSMKLLQFFFVSQLGMLPGTFVYIKAGSALGEIENLRDIATPEILLSFSLLGLFPLFAKKLLGSLKTKRALKAYKKPKKFDYNLIVIGGGSAGLVSSYIAAAVKAKVLLIEKNKMGGDCLNTGCVPSKALIRTAKFFHDLKRSHELGIEKVEVSYKFSDVIDRVHRVIKSIEPHDSVDRYSKLGVECLNAEAKIVSPWEVEASGKRYSARNIIIATGARPFMPPIPGLSDVQPLNSDNLWSLRELPKKLLVLGGGPIGSEMTQAFCRMGSQVTQVEMSPRLLGREDADISELIADRFRREGVRVLTNHKAKSFHKNAEGNKFMVAECNGQDIEIPFDEVLVAIGRSARVEGFGLEELGVKLNARRTLEVNEFLQTNIPTIWTCGDATGPYQFTHTAAHQAWYASINSLFGSFKRFAVDYRVIPSCTFTSPEIARVGLNELEATEQKVSYEVSTFDIHELDRAITEEEAYGIVKVLSVPGKDKILGVTIVGSHAGDFISEFVAAMKHGIGLNKILSTIHIYPTLAEANKYVAGQWKRAHVSPKVLNFLEKFHKWTRN